MSYEWYPGHMTRAKRKIEEAVRLTDMVLELRDARAPLASANPDIESLTAGKKKIILLSKWDLAEERITKEWIGSLRKGGETVLAIDARKAVWKKELEKEAEKLLREKRARDAAKGLKTDRPVKVMVLGIPNVGKSTFINSWLGRASLKAGDLPGVTRGNQWVNVSDRFLLLDTPGVLWPKIGDREVSMKLAAVLSMNDDIVDSEELALWLLRFLKTNYPDRLMDRYNFSLDQLSGKEALSDIAKRRSFLLAGGEADTVRASKAVVDDFRKGRLGRISLERADID